MKPSYATNAPQGYMGDWTRGAPLGRSTIADAPATFSGKLTLQRVRLDSGGYDPQGAYWGIGQPLYWYASDDGTIDGVLRASSREGAKQAIRQKYPSARFYR